MRAAEIEWSEEDREEIDFLARGLRLGEGFQLYLIRADAAVVREAICRALLQAEGLAVRVIRGKEAGEHIQQVFETILGEAAAGPGRRVTVIRDLNLLEPEPEVKARRLNEQRNGIMNLVGHGLVMMGTGEDIDALRKHAPDTWSVRSADLEFTNPDGRSGPELARLHPDELLWNQLSSEELKETIESLEQQLLGLPEGDRRARVLLRLANLTHRIPERAAEAIERARGALSFFERDRGPDHPDTASALASLGFLLQSRGDLKEARSCYERALAIWTRALGPEHPRTARALNNLGTLLQMQGDLRGARQCLERALAVRERVLGPEHPNTASSLHGLAYLLSEEGELDTARRYLERALGIWKKTLGPDHPHTARTLNNLGGVLLAQGDLESAEKCFQRAFEIFSKQYGADHPDTRISVLNLARLNEET